jgi:hypothetical protein
MKIFLINRSTRVICRTNRSAVNHEFSGCYFLLLAVAFNETDQQAHSPALKMKDLN